MYLFSIVIIFLNSFFLGRTYVMLILFHVFILMSCLSFLARYCIIFLNSVMRIAIKGSGLESPVVHHSFSHFGELVSFLSFRLKVSGRFQFRKSGSLFLSHYFSFLSNLLFSLSLGLCLNSSLLFRFSFGFNCRFFSGLSLGFSFGTGMYLGLSLKDAPFSSSLLDCCLV